MFLSGYKPKKSGFLVNDFVFHLTSVIQADFYQFIVS